MRKRTIASVLFGLWAGLAPVSAQQTVKPYLFDFNQTIDTSSPTFKLEKGWGHIADGYSSTYMEYKYRPTMGVGGTGCLYAPNQQVYYGYGWSGSYQSVCDLIVTPKITGSASIMVKQDAGAGEIAFYEVTRNADGTFSKGSKISHTVPELNQSDYTEVTLPTTSNGYVGIYAKLVMLDDFKADEAEIILTKSLKLKNIERLNNDDVYCDADGYFTLHYTVQAENTGEADLEPGDENFSVSIYNETRDAIVYTLPIAEALAVGATSGTIDLEGRISSADYPNDDKYMVRENISGSSLFGNYITIHAYGPEMKVYAEGWTSPINTTETQNWGTVQQPTTKHYTLRNLGKAPLEVSALSLPEGFTATPAAPFTVEADGEVDLSVTLEIDTYGTKNGNLTLTTNDPKNATFTLPLRGTVMNPKSWYVDFENNAMPGNMIVGDNWAVKMYSSKLNLADNKYRAETTTAALTKLVSPLLDVKEGDELAFKAGKNDNNSVLNVYYSSDRKNWQLAKAITAAADNEADRFGTENESEYTYDYNTYSYGYKYYYYPKEFALSLPAGKWYVAFEAGNAWVDDICGFELAEVDHDLMMNTATIPATGMVNNRMQATAEVKNYNNKAEAAGSYTARLYFGDDVVAEAEAVEMAAAAVTTFNFSCTPQEAGTFDARIEIAGDGFSLVSDVVSVTVSEEQAGGELQVGRALQTSYQSSPVNTWYKYSTCETLYTAAMLEEAGLKKGNRIASIAFKGYNTSSALNTDLYAWIENTDATSISTPFAPTETSTMTQLKDAADYTFETAGSSSEHVDMLTIDIADPFVYTGGSIRLITQSAASAWGYVYFEQDNSLTGCSYVRASDSSLDDGSWTAQPLPVTHFTVLADPATMSGTVTDEDGQPVEGATVTLTSGDVMYSAQSDADGAYTVNVIQAALDYTVTATAEGFDEYTEEETVSLAEGNVEKNIQLTAQKLMLEVSSYGWASFSADRAIDFSQTEGLTAYVVKGYSSQAAYLEEVTAVPAHTGVLVEAAQGSYELHTAAEATAPAVNLLQATSQAPFTVSASDYGRAYAFGVMNGKVGFVKASEGYTINTAKAYLMLDAALSAPFLGFGEEVATGIGQAEASDSDASASVTVGGILLPNAAKAGAQAARQQQGRQPACIKKAKNGTIIIIK